MKKLIFVVWLFLSVPALSQDITTVKIEQVIQEIDKQDDTTRVINLWATWCAPCVKELPYFDAVGQAHQDKKFKMILMAVEDDMEKVKRFISLKKIKTEVWFLDETDANMWIPKIDSDWQGELPVTLFRNTAASKNTFHSGQMSREELENTIKQSLN